MSRLGTVIFTRVACASRLFFTVSLMACSQPPKESCAIVWTTLGSVDQRIDFFIGLAPPLRSGQHLDVREYVVRPSLVDADQHEPTLTSTGRQGDTRASSRACRRWRP